jgi:hypothetical protein
MPYVIKRLQGLNVSYSGIMNTSFIDFIYSLDSFHIRNLYLDTNKTGIDMTTGDVVIYVSNFTLEWEGKVRFKTNPELLFGEGLGWFNLSRLNFTTKINFGIGENKLPNITIKESRFDISNSSVKMSFSGTNDIFQLMDMIQKFALPLIIEEIKGNMTEETMKSIAETLNGLLASIPSSLPIPGTHIEFDLGLVNSPAVTQDGYAPVAINGTASCVNKTACMPYSPLPIPPKKEDFAFGKGSFQLHIADYLLSSIFVAAYQDNLIKFTVTPQMFHDMTSGLIELNTTLIGAFIPEIRRRYGPNRNVTVTINAYSPPLATITEKYIKGMSLKFIYFP